MFDVAGGGNEKFHGYGGDDVYWLGAGTGHDAIRNIPATAAMRVM